MNPRGRSRELGHLRGVLDERRPHAVFVEGLRGGGKTTLVRHVLHDYRSLYHLCPPLPDLAQRGALLRRIRAVPSPSAPDVPELGPEADWATIFSGLLNRIEAVGAPFVLTLDDAHRLSEARSRHIPAIVAGLREAARRRIPFHVVLVGPAGALPTTELRSAVHPERTRDVGQAGAVGGGGDSAHAGIGSATVKVGPLPFRAAAPRLPGRRPLEKLRAYGIFGGIPRVLAHVDASLGVDTNVRRLLLAPEGALADAGARWLEVDLQAPSRYYAILSALSFGEADWATVHDGVPDLTRSGQVGPYLKRLEELGLVEARRSLDASPGGRDRRYAITDPFLAFWFRFLLPRGVHVEDAPEGAGGDRWTRRIRPRVEGHLGTTFPRICRQHMEYDAIETLGYAARESGSLWGSDHDLPVAGILTSGTPYYGLARWARRDDETPFHTIDRAMRETRYGFGRQLRLRLLFTPRPVSTAVRRQAARRDDAEIIDAEALLG